MGGHKVSSRIIALLLMFALASTVQADSAPLALRSALTNGGGTITAGSYTMTSSIGQPLVGMTSAGEFSLASGIPNGPAVSRRNIYLPLTRR